jgi:hypothetical protein
MDTKKTAIIREPAGFVRALLNGEQAVAVNSGSISKCNLSRSTGLALEDCGIGDIAIAGSVTKTVLSKNRTS